MANNSQQPATNPANEIVRTLHRIADIMGGGNLLMRVVLAVVTELQESLIRAIDNPNGAPASQPQAIGPLASVFDDPVIILPRRPRRHYFSIVVGRRLGVYHRPW